MSKSAPPFAVHASDSTLEMKVANMTFMLERLAQDCAPLQFVRELTQNAIDSITALGGQHGEIRWDVDWNRHELEPDQGFKLAVIDTGIGMTGPEMVNYINQLSSSMHEQSKHGNFGMGAKIAAAPRNTEGLVYLSWKEGRGSMIHLWKDPETVTYGLRRFDNGEFWRYVTDEIKPELIKNHGTMVVLRGRRYDEDTMQAPSEAQIPSRWILRYLNMRYFRFPLVVTVKARENWHLPRNHKHNMLRKVMGQEAFLKSNSCESGTVELKQAKAHWWILKEVVDSSGHYFSGGHVAALFDDELYEMAVGRPGVARLQSFGVIFGYSRVVIYVEPSQDQDGALTANTARTHLLIDGQPLPWTDWAAEFRENMPEPITRLMDQVASGAGNSENASSIRERLKQIRDLFRFSRYRPTPDGKHLIDDDIANTGGRKVGGGGGGGGGGSGSHGGGGGRSGDIYALFADTGETPADEVGGFTDPLVKWVSVRDGSRTADFLEDRAAKYLPQVNTIQANADFRVFTDMMGRWKKFYALPSAGAAVESIVKEWFQQQLVETVLGALALRKSGNWSEQEIEMLWSEEALTSAVLPRYHVDQSIKRALGSKLGTLKDKESALTWQGAAPGSAQYPLLAPAPRRERADLGCSPSLPPVAPTWDVATHEGQRFVTGHTEQIEWAALSPNGQTLATGGWDRTIRLWEAAGRRPPACISGHLNAVVHGCFTPNGKSLATASLDGTVKLWHVATLQELASLKGFPWAIWRVAFSSDGQTLAASGQTGLIVCHAPQPNDDHGTMNDEPRPASPDRLTQRVR